MQIWNIQPKILQHREIYKTLVAFYARVIDRNESFNMRIYYDIKIDTGDNFAQHLREGVE